MTPKQIEAVAEVLSDPQNGDRTAEEVAERVLEALDGIRKQEYKYVIIAQARAKEESFGESRRSFFPTWVKGPFLTLVEARSAANAERRSYGPEAKVKVMSAKVVTLGDVVDWSSLEEVLA